MFCLTTSGLLHTNLMSNMGKFSFISKNKNPSAPFWDERAPRCHPNCRPERPTTCRQGKDCQTPAFTGRSKRGGKRGHRRFTPATGSLGVACPLPAFVIACRISAYNTIIGGQFRLCQPCWGGFYDRFFPSGAASSMVTSASSIVSTKAATSCSPCVCWAKKYSVRRMPATWLR